MGESKFRTIIALIIVVFILRVIWTNQAEPKKHAVQQCHWQVAVINGRQYKYNLTEDRGRCRKGVIAELLVSVGDTLVRIRP